MSLNIRCAALRSSLISSGSVAGSSVTVGCLKKASIFVVARSKSGWSLKTFTISVWWARGLLWSRSSWAANATVGNRTSIFLTREEACKSIKDLLMGVPPGLRRSADSVRTAFQPALLRAASLRTSSGCSIPWRVLTASIIWSSNPRSSPNCSFVRASLISLMSRNTLTWVSCSSNPGMLPWMSVCRILSTSSTFPAVMFFSIRFRIWRGCSFW